MKLYSASLPTEAHIVCELLKAQGVDVEVRGEGLFGLQGELPFGSDTEPYIWLLNEYQYDKAKTIVDAYLNQSENREQPNWCCPECDEWIEAQFGACWKCGYQVSESVDE
ncbi:conserved hypothetical protein [Vibrio nigripulchritudo MADA3029]|uniref:putative signal transducing protein n=1 Tax=Vibrio nigripulchritudo TaxID=28173 RepID=UPI0003B1F19D|nr:DUF2007 domain-containing protein [Vibrio nigripulchritudo]CCN50415.1 conserved hypothetical protein [Vibrio nigripulchritudo MADA3020]CCN52365.1 conserved hypothetical protein [Vibrio nigripulchritudo MADA3021]CCN62192.1 conserved hypothetical protein [Vibrio nigripulchritudo MADA3029]CCN70578.1 conserved hypothetical protein [Vibrio nigripulchritudo SFn118]